MAAVAVEGDENVQPIATKTSVTRSSYKDHGFTLQDILCGEKEEKEAFLGKLNSKLSQGIDKEAILTDLCLQNNPKEVKLAFSICLELAAKYEPVLFGNSPNMRMDDIIFLSCFNGFVASHNLPPMSSLMGKAEEFCRFQPHLESALVLKKVNRLCQEYYSLGAEDYATDEQENHCWQGV